MFLWLSVLVSSPAFAAPPAPALPIAFALQRPVPAPAFHVDLQAKVGAAETLVSICGEDGSRCECEFSGEQGRSLAHTAALFDRNGYYFHCALSSGARGITHVRLIRGAKTSDLLPVLSELSVSDFARQGLDVNRVRTVFRYSCEQTFLQKAGTTETSFDCTNQATLCDSGGSPSNFCFLRTHPAFYLYADGYQDNIGRRFPDRFYAGGNSLCGLRIKKWDCAADGAPSPIFGLYGVSLEQWSTPVSLLANPEDSNPDLEGYAADPNESNECPPGLELRTIFTSTLGSLPWRITPSHNMPFGQLFTEVLPTDQTPPPLTVDRYSGGFCNGETCTMPRSFAGSYSVNEYSVHFPGFCVIPSRLLPAAALSRQK